MLKQTARFLLTTLVFSATVVGCGSVDENSGSISLTAPTYSNGVVTANATYKPSTGVALPNQKITFYWHTIGQSSGTVVYPPKDSYTDSNGLAPSELTLPSPRTEALIVYVKAGTGNLITGVQSVNAP
ncbi:MAG: hypothetical protein WCK54_11465 [Desulfuromonadales bacterium]